MDSCRMVWFSVLEPICLVFKKSSLALHHTSEVILVGILRYPQIIKQCGGEGGRGVNFLLPGRTIIHGAANPLLVALPVGAFSFAKYFTLLLNFTQYFLPVPIT